MSNEANGKIVKGVGGLYEVYLPSGERIECRAKGAFRYERLTPYVGDNVRIMLNSDGPAEIVEIFERKSCLVRPPIANLDVMFTIVAAADPAPVILTLDKLITIAEHNGVEPAVIITKSELDRELSRRLYDIYEKSGFRVFVCEHGCGEALKRALSEEYSGRTAAFAGASGVGKSTLMNSLFPGLELATGGLSRKTARGRHTTRHVELYPYRELTGGGAEGFLADTPGFSLIDLSQFDYYSKEDLPFVFREFEPYLGKCRYSHCTHICEEGCAIIDAIASGEISASRHESFRAIYEEIRNKHDWERKVSSGRPKNARRSR